MDARSDPTLTHQGLDNLPGEVVFLLQEIQEKDERVNREYTSLGLC